METWVLPKDTVIDDNKLYIVDYDTRYPSDPMDMSSHNIVHHIEEVPEIILYGISEVQKFESIIKEYKSDFEKRIKNK